MTNETCFADICCDLDGVLNSYKSGWERADLIPDPPVEGAIEALYTYLDAGLSVAIFSARSAQPNGIKAMREWLGKHDREYRYQNRIPHNVPHLNDVIFMPDHKPAAKVYIDDRGFRFEGVFPTPDELRGLYTPWNKKKDKSPAPYEHDSDEPIVIKE